MPDIDRQPKRAAEERDELQFLENALIEGIRSGRPMIVNDKWFRNKRDRIAKYRQEAEAVAASPVVVGGHRGIDEHASAAAGTGDSEATERAADSRSESSITDSRPTSAIEAPSD